MIDEWNECDEMWASVIYMPIVLSSVLLIRQHGGASGLMLLTPITLVFAVGAAATATVTLPAYRSWTGSALFVLCYGGGAFLLALALMPLFTMGLSMSHLPGFAPVTALIMTALLVGCAKPLLSAGRRRLYAIFIGSLPAKAPASLWRPALTAALAGIAAWAPLTSVTYPETLHRHVEWHPLAMPGLDITLVLLVPSLLLVACHDVALRRAFHRLFGTGDPVEGAVCRMFYYGAMLFGVPFALAVSLLSANSVLLIF